MDAPEDRTVTPCVSLAGFGIGGKGYAQVLFHFEPFQARNLQPGSIGI
jgi:hypothetical protein